MMLKMNSGIKISLFFKYFIFKFKCFYVNLYFITVPLYLLILLFVKY